MGTSWEVPIEFQAKPLTALPALSAPSLQPKPSSQSLPLCRSPGVLGQPQGPLAFTSHLTPQKGGVGSEPGGPPVHLCAPHLFQPRAGGSSATPGPGAATGEDERRAGSCMRNASETLSSSPGPHRSVFCLPSLNTQYQLGSQLGISRHFPNGQRAPR